MNSDINFMNIALEEAENALNENEVPVGAVVVLDGVVVSKAHNTRENGKNALHHAEIKAIDEACKKLGGWRLHKCELYVTLEPCVMCGGAIINSRIKRVVFGAFDERFGAFGSVMNLNEFPLNHRPDITSGVCETESSELLTRFFEKLRERKKENKNECGN